MNKKSQTGAEVVIWILVVVAGLFLANQAGLFSVFVPNVGQPSGTDSLVNKGYYPASSSGDWDCESAPAVYFRTSSINYSNNEAVAFSELSGSILDKFGYSGSTGILTGICANVMATDVSYCGELNTLVFANLPGGFRNGGSNPSLWKSSSRGIVCICDDDGSQYVVKRYYSTDSDASKVSDSISSIDSSKELASFSPIKDSGKYVCSGKDVVLKFCRNFPGLEIIDSCNANQPCEFKSNQQVPDGFSDIVKCSSNYKSNQKLCLGNTLFSTSIDGNSISSQVCGYQCNNGACIECQNGLKRCKQLPGTTTSIEICSGGFWTQFNGDHDTCIGLETCSNGICSSEFTDGQTRCFGNQPQVFRSSTQSWQNQGESCDLSCIENPARCQLECDLGYICAGGVLSQCVNSDIDNQLNTLGSCMSGFCSDNSKCLPVKQIGEKSCLGKNIMIGVSSGNSNDLNGGVTSEIFLSCTNNCIPNGTSPYCEKASGCEGKSGLSICVGNVKKTCSVDEQTYISSEDCTLNQGGYCAIQNSIAVCQQTAPECTGSKVCKNGAIFSCNNGILGNILDSCNGQGCNELTALCTDGCSSINTYRCFDSDSFYCFRNSSNNQLLESRTDCGSIGCNPSNGLCLSECTGEKSCSNGVLRQCNNGSLGSIVDSCNGIGCEGSTCKDECTILDTYSCSGANSVVCVKNISNNQKQLQTINCGIEGCDSGTGKCKSTNIPNSYTCLGQNLYKTDSNGFILPTVEKLCSSEPKRNGLTPFCQSSTKDITYNDCLVCNIQGQPICTDTQLYQCGDIYLGTPVAVQNCEVGCLKENNNYYCDQLNMIVSTNQNFLLDEDLNIAGLLKRSNSGKGLSITNIKGTLTIGTTTQTQTSSSGDSGGFGINFGKASQFGLGSYQVLVELPGYGKSVLVNVKVTNDFKIGISGDPILVLIPGTTPSVMLDIKGGNGVPDSIVGSSPPPGITSYEVRKNEALGKWQLFVVGEPGVYSLNLSAVQNTVRLEGQTISVEIRKPQLTISSGVPETLKPTKSNYDIKITGPTSSTTNQGIEPDSVTVTLNGQTISLANSNLGAGTYSPQLDLSEIGTYTLDIKATKSGYQDASYSKTIQVSSTGNVGAPGSNNTITPVCGNNVCDSGETTTSCPNDCKSEPFNMQIIVLLGIIIFIIWLVNKK